MTTDRKRIKTGWIPFYSLLIVWNSISIAAFHLAEIGDLPVAKGWPWLAVLALNVALIAAYCHEGRGALRKIPGIAAAFALIYAAGGILLSGYRFDAPLLEPIYRIAQLFVGESAWIDLILDGKETQGSPNTIVLAFNVARLAALLATVSGVLALVKKILDALKSRVFLESGHIVLCGLGEAGIEFVRKWQQNYGSDRNKAGKRLVIIEVDSLNPNVDTARDLGFGVMIGDVFDPAVMRKARLDQTEAVVMFLTDDKRNIELALELREWISDRRGAVRDGAEDQDKSKHATRLLIHVDDTGLARRLQDHSRAGAETYTDTRFFDFYESSARSLFQQFPMESSADFLDTGVVHLAIYGFSRMGEAVLREAVRLGIFSDRKPLRISVFDQRADEEDFQAGFWRSNRGLERLVTGNDVYRPIDVRVAFYPLADARRGIDSCLIRTAADNAGRVPATQHIVCFDNDELSASFALGLRDVLRELPPEQITARPLSWDAPIFARLKRRHGLARLFLEGMSSPGENKTLEDTPDTLYAFGMLDDLVDPEQLLDDRRDELAKVLHEVGYRPQRGEENPAKNIWRKQTKVPWRFLPLHYKGSNRAQADHIYVKLRSLGCAIHVPSRFCVADSDMSQGHENTAAVQNWESLLLRPADACAEPASSSDTWLNCLAKTEHDRWAVYHFLENWRYAEQRMDAARTHNNLTTWENLDDATKAYDAEHVKKLPGFVYQLERTRGNGSAARTICREVRVGIVGHLPARLEASFPWLTSSRDPSGTLPTGVGLARKAKSIIVGAASQILEQASNGNYGMPLKMVLVTAGAEGADRIIAEALLDDPCIFPEFELILPLPWEIYYMTFHKEYESRKASIDQFYKLAQHARSTMQLPLRFGPLSAVGQENSENDKGREDPHHKQLQLANAYMAQHCDYLIAAWDGREIGAYPAELNDEELLKKIERLPAGSEQSPYTEDAQPGGTWEAVRWWLNLAAIPETMQWAVQRRPVPAKQAPATRLLCLGADAPLGAMKSG